MDKNTYINAYIHTYIHKHTYIHDKIITNKNKIDGSCGISKRLYRKLPVLVFTSPIGIGNVMPNGNRNPI